MLFRSARLIVKQPSYRSGVSVTRGFRTTTQGFTERTTLEVLDKTSKRLGVAFHSSCLIRPLKGLTLYSAAVPVPATVSTAYWSSIVAYSAPREWSVELDCKGERFVYTVTGPSNQTIYIGTEPTIPLPTTRSILYYDMKGPGATYEAAVISSP